MQLKTTNIFSLLQSAQKFLESFNLAQAKSDAEVLLSAVLKVKRSKLPLIRNNNLSETEISLYEEYILRRSKREPAAYITGFCGFMQYEFKVNKNVLIPRAETELLVEEVLKIDGKKIVLDLCAGSGCIAVSLAKSGKFEKITAADISKNALEIAKENAIYNRAPNTEFILSDMFESLKDKKFDIIVSNPPYVSETEYKTLEPELKYEPKTALTADEDGLFFYKKIAAESAKYLNGGGLIFLELNANKAGEIKNIFQNKGFKNIEILKDYSNLSRILKAGI
ncbi:peptide chain release factor N(5)-glutamine methyltransferase [Endomicrobium proavitum]|uniref:Release factor glutamine methyltransferase n=1 Tax=Endomicrobium proavitum TaxID=1408281 RepID=A0A0G3WKP5_9BACT|nr:peptide chain release factor N(5)-glutamine methyltransferase [Endomicrobium proavitum]AKL98044.1 Glutamine methylase of release factor 1 [Endomicrobium proavitum]